jgi:sec-independent protein translocase protein TatC
MSDTAGNKKEMSFFGHLEELRWRLVKSAIAILLIGIVIFIYTEPIIETIYISMSRSSFITYRWMCWLTEVFSLSDSFCVSKDMDIDLISIKLIGQFTTNIYFCLIGGIVIAFPYIFHQIWSFVKPGLKKNEMSATRGIVIWASLLFLIGIGFGYFIIAPLTIQFFGTYTMSEAISNTPTIGDYIGLITSTTFWTGLLFELPVVIYILSKLGIVGPQFLRTYRKHAIVIVLIVAAVITPPDFISQVIVAIPILLLYEISIMISARSNPAG